MNLEVQKDEHGGYLVDTGEGFLAHFDTEEGQSSSLTTTTTTN